MKVNLVFNILFISLSLIIEVYSESRKLYKGYTVLRLKPTTESQLKYLHGLEEVDNELDFWKPPSAVNNSVDVMIPPHLKNDLEYAFREYNFIYQTLIEDVQKILSKERAAERSSRDLWDEYSRFATLISFLDTTVSANPSISEVEVIGKSYENRDLKLIKIGVGQENKKKPIIFINSGLHAREWIGPAFTTYLIKQLVEGYKSGDSDINSVLNTYDWYILPVANPDGYEYTHTTDRMWRKTRKPSDTSSCVGTDPNRNYGYEWGGSGSSSNPCSETYRGTSAFSELETKALSNYITANKDRIKAYFDVHSYGQYLLYPWSYTTDLTPDETNLNRLGKVFIDALAQKYNTKYTLGHSANVLYASAGSADDWAYGGAGVRYSYTVELRDTGRYGFILPADQIRPTGSETTDGFIAFAKILAEELQS